MFQILPQRIVPSPLMRMMKIAPSDAVESQKGFHYILPRFLCISGEFR